MRLEHLESFEAVARTGTFTRAAAEQFLAQPTLSRQISTLETELSAQLFQRGRRGTALTDAGRALLPIARRMLADAETARVALDEIAGLRRGRVRLGATPTLCVSLVADVLAAYSTRHPGIDLQVTEAGSLALMEQLGRGDLDLALVITREEQLRAEGIELVSLLDEQLVVVSARSSPGLAVPEVLDLVQLAALPQVAFNRSYALRAATDAAFAAHDLTPAIAVEGAEMDAVLRFVERGIGVAVVPAMVVADRPGLRSSRLERPALERTVNLARHRDDRPTTAAGAMEQLIFELSGALEIPGVVGIRR